METWCFKCKKKVEMLDPVSRIARNNRKLWEGKCIECEKKVALMAGCVVKKEIGDKSTGSNIK